MTVTIGITGPSCSGKTTLAMALLMNHEGAIIGLDNYFLPPFKEYWHDIRKWEQPESIDWPEARRVVRALKSGQETRGPYIHHRTKTLFSILLLPRALLIVDGFLLLHDTELRELLDFVVYLDVPDHVGVERRVARVGVDTAIHRGRFEDVVYPEYAPRRAVFESLADRILDGTLPVEENSAAIERVLSERWNMRCRIC